ncbi:MAG: orotate phosphoribosyltransferase [Casimicrobiaceae bacterium]|nr:orotate phosphoribosyltransferase [Casimicrobiaceae bacterium]MCX8099353.1 orotate phosphoribosyltransferase [Casimicrobiaceae bacterium]MDW8311225.1 orotate phosphoribosyltransferase [Burkholderiales bacterium]
MNESECPHSDSNPAVRAAAPEEAAWRAAFLEFALDCGVLRFGQFQTKSGRLSPYFFNSALFQTGAALARLGEFYAEALLRSGLEVDMLFGPAYKGIPLVAALAIALARHGRDLPYAFNRKEAKTHGDGGVIVGAPLAGRVLIVDDVITAGTSVRESVDLIRAHGATPAGVLIMIDRQERGSATLSAVEEVRQLYGIPVIAIATLDDVLALVSRRGELALYRAAIEAYRLRYGAA